MVRLGALGDVLRTFPLLKSLKEGSDAEVYYLTLDYYKDLLMMSPWVNTVFSYNREEFLSILKATNLSVTEKIGAVKRFFRQIRDVGFEEIYDLHNTRESVILTTVLSDYSPEIIHGNYLNEQGKIVEQSPFWQFYDALRSTHLPFLPLDRLFPLLRNKWYAGPCRGGIEIDAKRRSRVRRTLGGLGVDPGEPFVSVQLGAGKKERRWNLEEAGKVLRYFNENLSNPVLLLGNEQEAEYLDEVEQHGVTDYVNIADVPELRGISETVTILSLSESLLTVNTYAMHCASRLNIPFVGLVINSKTLPEGAEDSVIYQSESIDGDHVIELYEADNTGSQTRRFSDFPGTVLQYNDQLPTHYEVSGGRSAENTLHQHLRSVLYTRSFFGGPGDLEHSFGDHAWIGTHSLASRNSFVEEWMKREKADLEEVKDWLNQPDDRAEAPTTPLGQFCKHLRDSTPPEPNENDTTTQFVNSLSGELDSLRDQQ